MGSKIFLGLQHALLVLLFQFICAHFLEFIPTGARSSATGVCLTTLAMILSGFLLGIRLHRRDDADARAMQDLRPTEDNGEKEDLAQRKRIHALLEQSAVSTRPLFGASLVTSILLLVLGVPAFFLGAFDALVPVSTIQPEGLARTMFAADIVLFPGVLCIGLGAHLGVGCRPWTVLTALGGFGFLLLMVFLSANWAREAFYDPGVITMVSAIGIMLSLLLTGFLVSIVRKRLAFVELVSIALIAGYAVYLTIAVGPRTLIEASNLPLEQILVVLSLLPTIAFVAFLTVGGSFGFLLYGGGRFDAGFRYETGVALRYLRAHRKDGFVGIVTIIAVVGVCLGVMALIIVLSIMSGFENDLKQKILGAHAHIVINKRGYDFIEYEAVEKQIQGIKGVTTASAFLLGDGMISTDMGLSGTVIKGIDPRSEQATADLRGNCVKGKLDHLIHPDQIPGGRRKPPLYLPPELKTTTVADTSSIAPPIPLDLPQVRPPRPKRRVLPGILIGRELAKTLRAYVGDTVKLISPVSEDIGPLGPTPKMLKFRVACVFFSGMYEYDAKFTYIDMRQAQRFFGMREQVTGIEIKVDRIEETSRIAEEVQRRLGDYLYNVKDWRMMNKELFSALLLEKLAMFIALAMIVMVASFLIVDTLVMIVLQRGKEIAILKSIGAADASVMKIFVVQGLIVGVGGAMLGVIGGVAICLFLEKFGVELDPKIFYIERLPVVLDWVEISTIAIAAVVISYLATIYPAITAALLRPVEGLRDD